MHDWFETPPGRYLLQWEQAQCDHAVADIFGYHALQLGLPALGGLRANRMPHRWLAQGPADVATEGASPPRLVTDFTALPFPENSLDLVLLPHTLDLSQDPHATLRDVHRVLVPEGRVVICGLNPGSLWGLRQGRARLYRKLGFGELFLPSEGDFIAYWRLRDWLRLLGFEVETSRFGCYRPAFNTARWLDRCAWMDAAGERWWPIFGAASLVVAVKKVHGLRLMSPAWKARKVVGGTPVPVANNWNAEPWQHRQSPHDEHHDREPD